MHSIAVTLVEREAEKSSCRVSLGDLPANANNKNPPDDEKCKKVDEAYLVDTAELC